MKWFLTGLPISRFVHGATSGADTLGHYIVEKAHRGVPIELHPSNIGYRSILLHNPVGNLEIYPEADPLERNRNIVCRVHGLVAVPMRYPEDWGSGTWATVREARWIGLPVYVIRPDGRTVRDI
jgi:hypothetical protein